MAKKPRRPSRTYLVVGASGTIGSAVATQLASGGANIAIHYCNSKAKAGALAASIVRLGSKCVCIQSPLDSASECKAVVDNCYRAFGTLSGVAICSGTIAWKKWKALDGEDWQSAFLQHCVAPYFIARHAIGLMSRRKFGRIVYLSSISPKYGGSATTLHYAAAKSALETAMYGLSRHVADQGITINGVRAGFVDTPQQRRGRTPAEITRRIGKIPARRPGTPGEIASAVAYLMSDEASFINGELLAVAGGD